MLNPKNFGSIFFDHVFRRHFEFQNGRHTDMHFWSFSVVRSFLESSYMWENIFPDARNTIHSFLKFIIRLKAAILKFKMAAVPICILHTDIYGDHWFWLICKLEVTEMAQICLISWISIHFLLELDSVQYATILEFKMAAKPACNLHTHKYISKIHTC